MVAAVWTSCRPPRSRVTARWRACFELWEWKSLVYAARRSLLDRLDGVYPIAVEADLHRSAPPQSSASAISPPLLRRTASSEIPLAADDQTEQTLCVHVHCEHVMSHPWLL